MAGSSPATTERQRRRDAEEKAKRVAIPSPRERERERAIDPQLPGVMAGLIPAIRLGTSGGRDGRDKPGHDGERMAPRVVIIEVWYNL
jgi:hypothetical protein